VKRERREVNIKLWEFANKIDRINIAIKNRDFSITQAHDPLMEVGVDGMPHAKGRVSDTTFAAVMLIERYQDEKVELIQQRDFVKAEFEAYIDSLTITEKDVVRLRYLGDDRAKTYSAKRIGDKLGYVEDYVKQLIARAQDKIFTKI